MAWVGAIVVVLAAAFAVNVAIDRGWWGQLSPEFRCLMIAGFGGLLLLGGELALRRIGKTASAGLFGAGLGTLYLDAFAAFSPFELISREWAFAMMAAVAVGGFAITFRTRFLTIGVLSILGGFLTPVLLRGASTHHVELLSYLTMLLGISLALSALLPRSFRTLRYVALGGMAIVGLGWMVGQGAANWQVAIVFLSVWWAMILTEAVFAALQRTSALGNVLATLLATAAYAGVGIQILNGGPAAGSQMLGGFALMIALLAAAAAFQFGPGIDSLRRQPQTPVDKLAAGLWIQSGALLLVAAALQFDGFGQTISWLAMGVAAIEIGRRLPARSVAIFGLVAGALGVVRVTLIDWWQTGMSSTIWAAGEISISRWSLLMLAAVLATHLGAHRLRREPPAQWRIMPVLLVSTGAVLWLLVSATQCRDLTATAAWVLGAVTLLALEPIGRRLRYLEVALIVLIVAAAKWLLFDALVPRLERGWTGGDAWPVLNWQMGLAAAIAASGAWAFRIMRRRPDSSGSVHASDVAAANLWQMVTIGGTVFMLVALSLETDRAIERAAAAAAPLTWSVGQVRHLLLTLLWALGAAGLGVLAMSWRRNAGAAGPRILVQFCWAMVFGCAAKWIVFDTLYWSLFESSRSTLASANPVANLQMLVGVLLSIALMVVMAAGKSALPLVRNSASNGDQPMNSPAAWMPVGAALIVLWGLTFEVDRALVRAGLDLPMWLAIWPPAVARGLLWTALWAIGGGAMTIIGRWRRMPALSVAGWGVILICAAVWLTYDTLGWRIAEGGVPAAVVANLQFAVGALLVMLLSMEARFANRMIAPAGDGDARRLGRIRAFTLAAIGAMVLWMGSLEIDRALMNQPMAMQTGLSVYWGVFAVALVLLGFIRRPGGIAAVRYAGLSLLSVTALKVLFIDLAEVDNIARVISFLVSGLLLIGTSIVYSRLAPKLLGHDDETARLARSS